MRTFTVLMLCIFCWQISAKNPLMAQVATATPAQSATAAMTNADVITLAGFGLSDDVIIQKISNAKAVSFDTSIEGLKQLKDAKVPDAVIKQMLTQEAAIAAASPDAHISTFHSTDGHRRVYVTDHPMNEVISMIRGSSETVVNANRNSVNAESASSVGGVSHAQKGDDPRTVEIQADIQKNCPADIMVSNNPARADYILVFRREGGKRSAFFAMGGLTGLAIASGAKVDGASLFLPNGDMAYATRENTVKKAIIAACEHMPPL